MSLVTVSAKRNREYRRAFDHDEAQRLHAEGWTYNKLANHYGVSWLAIARVCDETVRARMNESSKQWMRENRRAQCKGGCGTLIWTINNRSGYCRACSTKRRTRTVRPDSLLCTRCDMWKPDEDFQRAKSNKGRRQRHTLCRVCSTEARRDHRHRNRERERTRERNYVRERRGTVTHFVVLEKNHNGYVEVGRAEAASAAGAVEKVATAAGEFFAVPEARLRPMRVEPVRKFAVVPQTGATESA